MHVGNAIIAMYGELENAPHGERAGSRRPSLGLNRAQVRARLGQPDDKQWASGTKFWIYFRADLDYQTRTVIKFNSYGTLFDVERIMQRRSETSRTPKAAERRRRATCGRTADRAAQ